MTPFFQKLRSFLQRRRKEAELRDELQFHLDEEAEERRADGLTGEAARLAARREMGNVTLLQEETRAVWAWTSFEQLLQDCRYGLRTMAGNKTFTVLAVLSLALGIGANTAIYSFMDSLLLRSLPVSDPESLAVLNWRAKPAGRDFVMRSMSGSTWGDEKSDSRRNLPVSRLRSHSDQLRRGLLQRVRVLPHAQGEPHGRRARRNWWTASLFPGSISADSP